MPHHDATQKRHRLMVLSFGLGILLAAYLAVGLMAFHTETADEQSFASQTNPSASPLEVYAELLSVDAVRDAVDLRLDFASDRDGHGFHFGTPASRDMVVGISDGDAERQVTWRRGQPMVPLPLSVDIRKGNVWDYPFDRYTATLTISAHEGTDTASGTTIPVRLTVWQRLPAWTIGTTATRSPAEQDTISLTFAIRRAGLPIIFAMTVYCAMAVMAVIALTMGSLLFLGIRRMDTTMAAVLAAMIFTIPGLRSVMPGNPPLGVHGDNLVFFWAEISVVIGLALTIAAWAIGDR